jgi:hypothetical protein
VAKGRTGKWFVGDIVQFRKYHVDSPLGTCKLLSLLRKHMDLGPKKMWRATYVLGMKTGCRKGGRSG